MGLLLECEGHSRAAHQFVYSLDENITYASGYTISLGWVTLSGMELNV